MSALASFRRAWAMIQSFRFEIAALDQRRQ
jgi:hypothetical protein